MKAYENAYETDHMEARRIMEHTVYYFKGPDGEGYAISDDFWPKVVSEETAAETLGKIYLIPSNKLKFLRTETAYKGE